MLLLIVCRDFFFACRPGVFGDLTDRQGRISGLPYMTLNKYNDEKTTQILPRYFQIFIREWGKLLRCAHDIRIYNVLSNRNALTISNIFGSSESCLITLFSISIFYHETDVISFDYKQANKIRVSFHVTKIFSFEQNR